MTQNEHAKRGAIVGGGPPLFPTLITAALNAAGLFNVTGRGRDRIACNPDDIMMHQQVSARPKRDVVHYTSPKPETKRQRRRRRGKGKP